MKYLYILLILLITSSLGAQSGFIETFQYKDSIPVRMQNVLYDEYKNTLITSGISLNTQTGKQGLYIRELDTLGNFIKDTIINDVLGDDYGINQELPFISTAENGYAVLLGLFFTGRNVFIEFDESYNIVGQTILEEDSTEIQGRLTKGLYEIDDGYIVHSHKQHIDFRSKPHLIKLNKHGEVLWEKEYGEEGFGHSDFSISHNNKIYISGARGNDEISVETGLGRYLYEIDHEGELLREHYFPLSEPNTTQIMSPISIDDDGNFIIDTSPLRWGSNAPESTELEISKYDEDLDLIWTKPWGYSEAPYSFANWSTITTDTAGNIIASGNSVSEDLMTNPVTLLKLSPYGDEIWTRLDTLFPRELNGIDRPSTNETAKHIILPSGSIVMCGTTTTESEAYGNTRYGYIIKVNKNGCIEPDCHGVMVDIVEVTANPITVYPNPSSGLFHIDTHEKSQIQIFNNVGQLVLQLNQSSKLRFIDLSKQPDGVYYARIETKNHLETVKLLKKGN